jgi:hypothetical protein
MVKYVCFLVVGKLHDKKKRRPIILIGKTDQVHTFSRILKKCYKHGIEV